MRHIPARGRKPHLTLPPASRRTDASHPRQGTETNKRRCPAACCCRMRYIPARGRKHIAVCVIHNWEDRDTSYPREGMETEGYPRTAPSVLMCHIPARGRKPYPVWSCCHCSHRCTISPRGDGNCKTLHCFCISIQKRHIPARGRKPGKQHFSIVARARCVTSPQGDGNFLSMVSGCILITIRYIPARGRKRVRQHNPLFRARCAISPPGDGNSMIAAASWPFLPNDAPYPRQGTETRPCWWRMHTGKVTPHPRKGTEARRCPAGCRCDQPDASHPRKGTETSNLLTYHHQRRIHHIPARGRKTVQLDAHIISDEQFDAPYPREGTEIPSESANNNITRHIPSPPGDNLAPKFNCKGGMYRAPANCIGHVGLSAA